MNFMKRAVLSTLRKKGKSMILLVTIFILGNLIAGSIAVKQATSNVEKTIKSSLGAQATITFDWSDPIFQTGEAKDMPKLSDKQMKELGKVDGVKYYEYNLVGGLASSTYKAYYGDKEMLTSEGDEYFELYGVQIPELADIKEKKIKLTDGRTFTKEEVEKGSPVTLVSSKFAELNNIHVGDMLSFKQNAHDYSKMGVNEADSIVASRDVPLEVIGIFDPSLSMKENNAKNQESGNIDFAMMNRLYVPNATIREINLWNSANSIQIEGMGGMDYPEFSDITYYLNDSTKLDAFKKAADGIIPKGLTVQLSSDAYDQVAGPVSFISWLATGILFISIGATILILGLVVVLFLRDRRHEFGIYLSIGTRKWKIVSQVVIEVMIVGIIGLTLSLFTGNMLAKNISNEMLIKQQGQTDPNYPMGATGYPSGGSVDQNEVIEAYEVTLSLDYVLLLYGIGLGTLLIASIAPTVYVVRLKPRKVLL